MTDPILDKIRKLMSLADNNDNEHQAAAAMAKVQELMERHNLDLATVAQSRPDETGNTRADNKRKGGLYQWQRDIWKSVAELNFCMYWAIKGTERGSTYQHRILGREVNVIATEVMADYLQETIERMAKEYAKERNLNVFCRDMIAYREGLADRLRYRLHSARIEREREEARKAAEEKARQSHPGYASTGTSLVLADVANSEADLNTDYLNRLEPGTTARQRAAQNARYEAHLAAVREKARVHEERMLSDPEYAAEYNRIAEAEKADSDEWLAKYEKKQARQERAAERRREKLIDAYGYDPRDYRYRAKTAREQRAELRTHTEGYNDAADISLNQQIDEEDRLALKGE